MTMFDLDDNIMRQLRETFKIEAAEHIQALNRLLLALEQNPGGQDQAKLIEEIFREAHSLKGAAGATDFGDVERVSHKLETVFGVAKTGKITPTRELFDLLYTAVDAITILVESTFQEQPHGLDLDALYARLGAAERGETIAPLAPAQPAVEAVPEIQPAAQAVNSTPAPEAVIAEPAPATQVATPVSQAAPSAAESQPVAPKAPPPAATQPAAPQPAKTAPKPVNTDAGVRDTIRVSTTKIDALMTQAGELLVAGLKIDQRLKQVEEMSTALEEINREWLKIREAKANLTHAGDDPTIQTLLKLLDENQEGLRALSANVGELRRGFSSDALHLSRVANDVGEGVMKVRMLPVSCAILRALNPKKWNWCSTAAKLNSTAKSSKKSKTR